MCPALTSDLRLLFTPLTPLKTHHTNWTWGWWQRSSCHPSIPWGIGTQGPYLKVSYVSENHCFYQESKNWFDNCSHHLRPLRPPAALPLAFSGREAAPEVYWRSRWFPTTTCCLRSRACVWRYRLWWWFGFGAGGPHHDPYSRYIDTALQGWHSCSWGKTRGKQLWTHLQPFVCCDASNVIERT